MEHIAGPADELDAICRAKLPDGAIRNGILAGREAEIRQDALIMSLTGHLQGRPLYLEAKARGDQEAMHTEMVKCACSALQICKWRMERKLGKSYARSAPLDEQNGGVKQHDANMDTTDWPLSARIEVALRAADEAVQDKRISPMNAGILTMILRDGMNVERVSRRLGISTNAIYQQLDRVKRELPEYVGRVERIVT